MRGLQLNNTKNNIQTVYLMIMFCILTKKYYQVIRAFKKHCLLGSYTILQKKSSLYNYLLRLILVFLFMYVSIKKYQTRDGLVLLTFVLYYYYGKIISSRLSDLTFTFSQSYSCFLLSLASVLFVLTIATI